MQASGYGTYDAPGRGGLGLGFFAGMKSNGQKSCGLGVAVQGMWFLECSCSTVEITTASATLKGDIKLFVVGKGFVNAKFEATFTDSDKTPATGDKDRVNLVKIWNPANPPTAQILHESSGDVRAGGKITVQKQ